MKIENFKLKNFMKQKAELINEYITVLQYLNPKKTELDIYHMSLRDVEYIKKNLYSHKDTALIDIIKKAQGLTEKAVYNLRIIDFFGFISSVKKQIEVINNAELSSLTPSHTNFKWESVQGSERMAKFGIYNTLDSLSNGNALKYKEFMDMEYSEIFTILLMRKTSSDLQNEMNAIKSIR